MFPRHRLFLIWFVAGIFSPLALGALSALMSSLEQPSASWVLQGLALGSCPFWLFLWLPAMAQPSNSLLFYSVATTVLIANGCLYLAMAQIQYKTRMWKLKWRILGLAVTFPALMALGYLVPLGADLL